MSNPMTMQELGDLLSHVRTDHSFCQNNGTGRHVKYVDPKIDTRDWMCFAITFRLFGEGVTLHTQNECRDLPESLFERCMSWLDESTSNAGGNATEHSEGRVDHNVGRHYEERKLTK